MFVDGSLRHYWRIRSFSDLAFTNRIVVQPFDDGTFRYLSNSIEQKELKVPKAPEY
ncbi:MAG: hypothetical protein HFI53_04120 [Lachnospiraceae bacterium]|nr:hypothetical protein [Lachnospiraceae bacterium]